MGFVSCLASVMWSLLFCFWSNICWNSQYCSNPQEFSDQNSVWTCYLDFNNTAVQNMVCLCWRQRAQPEEWAFWMWYVIEQEGEWHKSLFLTLLLRCLFLSVQNLGRPYWLTLAPMYIWIMIFFSQPHKEERFLFPIYPLICLCGAVALSALQVSFSCTCSL